MHGDSFRCPLPSPPGSRGLRCAEVLLTRPRDACDDCQSGIQVHSRADDRWAMKLFAEALERKRQSSSRTNSSRFPPQQQFESKDVGWCWLYDPFEHPNGYFNFAGYQPEEAVLGLHLGLKGSLSRKDMMRSFIWKAYFRKHGTSSGDRLYKSPKLC